MEGASPPRLASHLLLGERWDPPDKEARRGKDGPLWSLLQLEEERRALGVRCCELENKVLAGERLQVPLRTVEDWRLVH